MRLCVKCDVSWENEWRHNVTIASGHLKHHDVDWMFGFHQNVSVFTLKPKYCENFLMELPAWMPTLQDAVFKILEGWIPSWCCFPYRQRQTDSSLLHSRQHLKHTKCIREINNLRWWQFTHYMHTDLFKKSTVFLTICIRFGKYCSILV